MPSGARPGPAAGRGGAGSLARAAGPATLTVDSRTGLGGAAGLRAGGNPFVSLPLRCCRDEVRVGLPTGNGPVMVRAECSFCPQIVGSLHAFAALPDRVWL